MGRQEDECIISGTLLQIFASTKPGCIRPYRRNLKHPHVIAYLHISPPTHGFCTSTALRGKRLKRRLGRRRLRTVRQYITIHRTSADRHGKCNTIRRSVTWTVQKRRSANDPSTEHPKERTRGRNPHGWDACNYQSSSRLFRNRELPNTGRHGWRSVSKFSVLNQEMPGPST